MTLVLGSEHNHRYEMPCTTQRSCESTTNTECIPGTKNRWIPIDSNYFLKPRIYAKCGNMLTSKRKKTSNYFEPLSNFNDTPNGNRTIQTKIR